MKTVIFHVIGARGGRFVREAFSRWLEALREEHAGYYGTPHGSDGHSGFLGRLMAAEILIREVADRPGCPTLRDILAVVVDPEEPLGGWRTSAGNLTLVCGVWEYRSGRRHGVRQALPAVWMAEQGTYPYSTAWVYLETQRPDLSPDATAEADEERVLNRSR